MNFDSDEAIMKAIMGGGGGGGAGDIDAELDALEAEIQGDKKKKGEDDELDDLEKELDEEEKPKPQPKGKAKPKNNEDDELAALEKEGLDDVDLDEEDEKPKPQKKPEVKQKTEVKQPPPPKVEKKEQPKPQPKKEDAPKGVDLYPDKAEKKYHGLEKMNCLGVLQKEKEVCDKIIEYKKKIGADYDDWDNKKENIDDKIKSITSFIEDEIWDLNAYKQKIAEQFKWESKLLLFVEKDPTLNDQQKKVLKDRIEARRNIIESELKQEVKEGGGEEPKKEEAPKGVDLYPDKVEKKYHGLEKMNCLGVLQKEKEVCDKIIEYKKKIGADYDDFDNKKENIDEKIKTITSFIEDGVWDINAYKKKIAEQFKWESKLLLFVEKDPTLNDQQKKILRERVNARKKIIETEMNQKVDQEEEPKKEETKKPESKKEEKKTETKKEVVKKNPSLSPMYSVPKDKEEEEKNRINQVVVDRLNEYRAALDYFQTNELGEQRIDATNKAKLICIELKKIQDGKWKEVNEFKLPDPITPEYIYGYKKEERIERFKKVILDYDRQRKEIQTTLNDKLAALKKLPASKLKKIQAVVTKDLNEMKSKKEKLDKIINLLKEKMQDSWVPAPLFIEQDREIKTEKIDKDIPEFHVKIIFGKTTYSKDKSLYLIVSHKEKNQEKKFDQKKPGDWSQEFLFKYEKGEFKSFYRSKIHVDIWEKRVIFKDTLKGQFDIEPKELKDQLEVTKECPITLESGRKGQTATVTFKVRTPCKDPEYLVETKSFLQVTKIYPPFNLKGGNKSQQAIKMDVQTAQVNAQDLSVGNTITPSSQKPTPGAKPQAQRPKPPQGGKPGGKPGAGPKKPAGPPIDKSQFTDEELNDPDCINCLQTLMVLKFKENKYEEIRSKIDGRTPRELMQRITRIKCKYKTLENSMGDDISPQDYLVLLRTTFEHDKKLAEYFKQKGDKDKFNLVNERLPLIFKEIEELVKSMPK